MMDPYFAAAAGAAGVALIVSIAVLVDAILDLRAVGRLGLTNGRRAIAINAVRDEASRSIELAIIVAVAWAASILGSARARPLSGLELVPRIGIVVVVALFTLGAIADLRFRIHLREIYRARAVEASRDESDRPATFAPQEPLE